MRIESQFLKRVKISIIGFLFLSYGFLGYGYAKEITILYTGSTHAMLYPCSCPIEADGGVARRATLIKQLRKNNPQIILLDSGSFFAGGRFDEYTQNLELDKARTEFNLKAMELMNYDAVSIAEDEFNFGEEFLSEKIREKKINFISCNLKLEGLAPYIIREILGVKVGIVGLTGGSAIQKVGALKFIDPKLALKKTLKELKEKGIDLIFVLAHLREDEERDLLNEIKEIDVLFSGYIFGKTESLTRRGSTLVVRPAWQGRRLNKLSLVLENNKIKDYKLEEMRLSHKIKDDPQISKILPQCFSDADCKKSGFVGLCNNPGKLQAHCLYSQLSKIELLVISPKFCRTCQIERFLYYLKKLFPGIKETYLYYPDKRSKDLIRDLGIEGLPAYILSKDIEREKDFASLKPNLIEKKDAYLINPQFSGLSYFLGREKIPKRLDLFISLYDKDTGKLLKVVKEFAPSLHFLAQDNNGHFEALRGNLEVEDYLRAVCVNKYYPQKFWDYLICRADEPETSWWQDCLGNLDTDSEKIIKECSRSDEAKQLLRENILLNKELKIMFGPVFLLDNQEVFSVQGEPNREELERIIKK